MESDPDGTQFLRVQEQAYDPFAPGGAQKVVADQDMGPAPGSNYVVEGDQSTSIRNVSIHQMKYGLTLQASGDTAIYNYRYNQFDGGGSIYGAAIKLGDNGRPTNGSTYIQRVVGDGMQDPDPTYKERNTDFIGVELDSGPIYIRDVSGKNFGDAGVDTKSSPVYIMNATFSHVHRVLRVWPNVEVVVVNSIINGTADNQQAWLGATSGTVRYYNTLWCMDAANPGPTDPNCRTTPWVVEGEDMNFTVAAARFIPLDSNPLPSVSPFFATAIDQIVVEYSDNNGGSWKPLNLPNTGGPGTPPIGDPRYRIPLDLSAGNYLFRASYRKNGQPVGSMSAVIDEQGVAR